MLNKFVVLKVYNMSNLNKVYSKDEALAVHEKYQYLKGQYLDMELKVQAISIFPKEVSFEEILHLHQKGNTSEQIVAIYPNSIGYYVAFLCMEKHPIWIVGDVEEGVIRIFPEKAV